MYPAQTNGYKRKCTRCRVDRHDRCAGAEQCGCTDQAHAITTDAMSNLGLGPDGRPTAGAVNGTIDELPDDTMVGLEIGIELGIYRRLAETACLQDRTVDMVIRRALEHAWGCGRGVCLHEVDPVAGAV